MWGRCRCGVGVRRKMLIRGVGVLFAGGRVPATSCATLTRCAALAASPASGRGENTARSVVTLRGRLAPLPLALEAEAHSPLDSDLGTVGWPLSRWRERVGVRVAREVAEQNSSAPPLYRSAYKCSLDKFPDPHPNPSPGGRGLKKKPFALSVGAQRRSRRALRRAFRLRSLRELRSTRTVVEDHAAARRCSYSSICCSCCNRNPSWSTPLSRQCFANGSSSNVKRPPSGSSM